MYTYLQKYQKHALRHRLAEYQSHHGSRRCKPRSSRRTLQGSEIWNTVDIVFCTEGSVDGVRASAPDFATCASGISAHCKPGQGLSYRRRDAEVCLSLLNVYCIDSEPLIPKLLLHRGFIKAWSTLYSASQQDSLRKYATRLVVDRGSQVYRGCTRSDSNVFLRSSTQFPDGQRFGSYCRHVKPKAAHTATSTCMTCTEERLMCFTSLRIPLQLRSTQSVVTKLGQDR